MIRAQTFEYLAHCTFLTRRKARLEYIYDPIDDGSPILIYCEQRIGPSIAGCPST